MHVLRFTTQKKRDILCFSMALAAFVSLSACKTSESEGNVSQATSGSQTNVSATASWAQTVSAGAANSRFDSVAVDSSGNIYVSGFQAGTGTYTYGAQSTAVTAGTNNIALVKYSAAGIAQWARTVSAGSSDSVFESVTVDSSGNIYAAGSQRNTGTFTYGSINAAATHTSFNPLLVKYDTNGNALWVRTVSAGSNVARFHSVATDSSANIYAAGRQTGTGAFTYSGQSISGASVGVNATLVKYDSSGAALWAQTVASGASSSYFSGIAIDASSNVYAVGLQSGAGTYTYGTQSATGTHTSSNCVIVKYNSSGVAQWARTVSAGSNISQFNSVAVDSSGNTYAVGAIYGTGTFTFGSQSVNGVSTNANLLIVKYDSSGNALWARSVGAGSSDSAFYGVTIDSAGNIHAAGMQRGTGTFTYGNQNISSPHTGTNALLLKYSPTGTVLSATTVNAGANESSFQALAADTSGHVYAAGAQNGNTMFTFGSVNSTATNAGGSNSLLIKYQ
ncbi:hypothetical protein [Turneriella parva]|nr:hypothetical protein [Turneriella parva]